MTVHTFDTGLAVPQRTLIREGAVALLAKLKRPAGYLANVSGFGGIVRSYTDQDDIQILVKALGPTPSIGVATGTRTFESVNVQRTQAKSSCELILYFANQHSRDMLVGRHESDVTATADAHADPGLDVIMAHALELMHGAYPSQMGTTIKQIQIKREEELATLPEITIWMQTYAVELLTMTPDGRGGKEWRTPEQLLTSIGWRTTTDPDEAHRPDPATSPTTIDADTTL